LALLEERISRFVLANIQDSGKLEDLVLSIQQRANDPYTIVAQLAAKYLQQSD
jgi:hypothetical protein